MLMNSICSHKDNQSDHEKTLDPTQEDSSTLYDKLKEGLDDIALGNTRPFTEAIADVKVKRFK